MKNTALEVQTQLSDIERARLRVLVSAIDGKLSDAELTRQPGPTTGGNASVPEELIASWEEVVRLLALGRAPELRDCPSCGNVGMRAARLCGFCWANLPSLPSA